MRDEKLPQKVTVYLGIPYAHPPIKELRFSAPVTNPPVTWNGIKNATKFSPSCMQLTGNWKLAEKLYRQLLADDVVDPGVSEDCLYLNLFVPDGTPPVDGWPVMVWFHSGDFNTGTPAIWDATIFVNKQKILVVTVAYRLNIFGFFTSTDSEAPGNYGMLDQVASLDWIKKNIKLFDGSSDNVAIAGHSSGAISVGLHILSPLSKGKFKKAILMSGDAIEVVRTPELEKPIVEQIANKFGCDLTPKSRLMECLRNVKDDILLNYTSYIESWGPIVDGEINNSSLTTFLPMDPKDILINGDFNGVPIMAGYTNNEQVLAFMEITNYNEMDDKWTSIKFEEMMIDDIRSSIHQYDDNTTCEIKTQLITDAVLFFYRPYPLTDNSTIFRDRYLDLHTEKTYAAGLTFLAEKISKLNDAYVYRFDYRPRTISVTQNLPEWAGVPHMFELPFVWGLPHFFPNKILWNGSDKNLADVMMMMIGNFLRTSSPTLHNVRWEKYTEKSPGILIINRTISMSDVNDIDYRALAFWNYYYPKIIDEAVNNCCNTTIENSSTNYHQIITNYFYITICFVCLTIHIIF
ncbi:hypothetical protein HCN44_008387 [Aphidius gifuensis]|uniref:Carboxylesterase type B domain-containing protein n=1 Tax=Aphidius gifuensis TaxID=684658 RepID=A0A834XM18_APHGI|nr:hypothetical protein HCN44_008387 [Aphidius gifuensis]